MSGPVRSIDVAVSLMRQALSLLARLKTGQSVKQVTAWAKDQLEGFLT